MHLVKGETIKVTLLSDITKLVRPSQSRDSCASPGGPPVYLCQHLKRIAMSAQHSAWCPSQSPYVAAVASTSIAGCTCVSSLRLTGGFQKASHFSLQAHFHVTAESLPASMPDGSPVFDMQSLQPLQQPTSDLGPTPRHIWKLQATPAPPGALLKSSLPPLGLLLQR